MKWFFSDANTLVEQESGYMIQLLSGTWFHPGQLKPITPPDMSFSDQIKYLRAGMSHMKSIGSQKHAS